MLISHTSTQAYFREALEASQRKSPINLSESAQAYLVHLLNEFSRSEKAFAGTDYGEKISMAQLLERALSAEPQEALSIFRHLGDISLYLLGFFPGSETQRLVNRSYYIDMGSQAYAQASHLARPYRAHTAALYCELSERFDNIIILLENMAKYNNNIID